MTLRTSIGGEQNSVNGCILAAADDRAAGAAGAACTAATATAAMCAAVPASLRPDLYHHRLRSGMHIVQF